jgi:hypothetical protein
MAAAPFGAPVRARPRTTRQRQAGAQPPTRRFPVPLAAFAVAAFLLLGWSRNHYWDEYFYLYSALAHSPRELIGLEHESGLFPVGFFSGKIGHVVLLEGLIALLGVGRRALLGVQFVYTAILLGFVAAGYAVFRQLVDARRSRRATAVLLFLPVTMYLAWKPLSETPSLLLVTLACAAFLASFRAPLGAAPAAVSVTAPVTAVWRSRVLVAASILALALGALCRITMVVCFAGLVAALLAAGDRRFPRRRVIRRAVVVFTGAALLAGIGLALAGGSDLPSLTLAWRVATRPNPLERVYALFFAVQAFLFVLLLVPPRRWSHGSRLALTWMLVAAVPFMAGHEPRYYAPALLPLALLAASGLQRLSSLVGGAGRPWAWGAALAGIVLVNRAGLSELMPHEVDQRDLAAIVPSSGTLFVPWTSDYGFLRFAFPRRRIFLALSETNDSDYHWHGRPGDMRPQDQAWAGGGYAGGIDTLERQPGPWYYVGWTYNPAVLRARTLFERMGIHLLDDFDRLHLHSHLAGSWIWWDPALELRPVARRGRYSLYRIERRPERAQTIATQ